MCSADTRPYWVVVGNTQVKLSAPLSLIRLLAGESAHYDVNKRNELSGLTLSCLDTVVTLKASQTNVILVLNFGTFLISP